MKQGFVTIATGDAQYYRMARTLLRSYRQNCPQPLPFAILCDRENEFTAEFDDVVILPDPKRSWMDKMALLTHCPYDENLFLDADCTVYRDINHMMARFSGQSSDFSCFGLVLPTDSENGWFTRKAAELYPIRFITHLHGISYFVRKSPVIDELRTLCDDITVNYEKLRFSCFPTKLADEPIFALAMAVLDLKPIQAKPDDYCFVPSATSLRANYLKRKTVYRTPWDGKVRGGCILHWSNAETIKGTYRLEAEKIDHLHSKKSGFRAFLHECIRFHSHIPAFFYFLQDARRALLARIRNKRQGLI